MTHFNPPRSGAWQTAMCNQSLLISITNHIRSPVVDVKPGPGKSIPMVPGFRHSDPGTLFREVWCCENVGQRCTKL